MVCQAADDGGLQQHFLLEALESVRTLTDNQSIVRNYFPMPVFKVLGSEPVFLLQGLEPGRSYQLRIYAVNNKGQSDPPVVIPYAKIENSSSKLQSIGKPWDQKYRIFKHFELFWYFLIFPNFLSA